MYICLRTFCNRSASALVVADQTFMVGPGVSPVLAKLVSQIVAGKYVDLCDLLPAYLQIKEPETQLQLFNFHEAGASVHSPSSNDSSDWEPTGSSKVLWFASPGTGGVALRLSPSAATRTAAPPVLVPIVQQLVQLRGLSIPGRTEKCMLHPLQLRVPPREASLAALRVFSLFR